jgi:hypothetical protein
VFKEAKVPANLPALASSGFDENGMAPALRPSADLMAIRLSV